MLNCINWYSTLTICTVLAIKHCFCGRVKKRNWRRKKAKWFRTKESGAICSLSKPIGVDAITKSEARVR